MINSQPPITLLQAKNNTTYVVDTISGGGRMRARLTSMGIQTGITIRIIQINRTGPIIVQTGNSRIAIGRGMLDRITIREAVNEE